MATTQPGDTDVERLLGTVGEAMTSRDLLAPAATSEPVVASVDWSLARAGLAMDEAGVNRLPVVDAAGRHPHPRRPHQRAGAPPPGVNPAPGAGPVASAIGDGARLTTPRHIGWDWREWREVPGAQAPGVVVCLAR